MLVSTWLAELQPCRRRVSYTASYSSVYRYFKLFSSRRAIEKMLVNIFTHCCFAFCLFFGGPLRMKRTLVQQQHTVFICNANCLVVCLLPLSSFFLGLCRRQFAPKNSGENLRAFSRRGGLRRFWPTTTTFSRRSERSPSPPPLA